MIYHTHSQKVLADGWIGRDDGHGAGGSPDKPFAGYLWDSCLASSGAKYSVDRRRCLFNAEPEIRQVLADNPTIQVVIDLHRDGVGDDVHLVTDIGGKQTAKIMFFNGLKQTTSTGPIDYLQIPKSAEIIWRASLQIQIAAAELYPVLPDRSFEGAIVIICICAPSPC